MGTVYLAEQTFPIQRKVALKVVKPGMDSKQVLSRFNHERQAVAMMDHPNIARVYDADITANGRPFFVMEYVDGLAITQYCDDRRLNTEQRLAIFIKVCSAVQHAHGKGIIHRDIKPSNVMVSEVDGEAVPKVIDFGIAKATDHRGLDVAAFTEFGQFIGTPEYMSPEQADVMTGLVDTGSDVYSLGILLYELLAGAVPFDGGALRKAGLVEMLRIVREVEAPSMHARLSSLGGTASDIAAMRATTLPELRRKLSGDLNWIVTRAVEKQSGRRYASVSDLGADIGRHLNH
jgi:serine/threonine protein kinase